jgi:hypothetical protein
MLEELRKKVGKGSSAFQLFMKFCEEFREGESCKFLGENPKERVEKLLAEMSENERVLADLMFDSQILHLLFPVDEEKSKPCLCLDSKCWYCIGDRIHQGAEMLVDDAESPVL